MVGEAYFTAGHSRSYCLAIVNLEVTCAVPTLTGTPPEFKDLGTAKKVFPSALAN